MQKMRVFPMLVIFIFMFPHADAQQPETPDPAYGNGLLELCNSTTNYYHKVACLSFISGVVDGLALAAPRKGCPSASAYFCMPAKVTRGQTHDVVVKYLKEHPETRQEDSASLIYSAVREAWPCH
jgi:hypothetical protein